MALVKKCKDNEVVNPITNRCIDINGATYKRVFKQKAKLNLEIKKTKKKLKKLKQRQPIVQPVVRPVKQCPPGKVLNTHTNRCIKVGTGLYKLALKNGWVPTQLAPIPAPIPPPAPPQAEPGLVMRPFDWAQRNCKNATTFMLFDNVEEIPDSDLLITPNGFCFSSEELVSYIASDAFNNRNPHDISLELFKQGDTNAFFVKDHPKVIRALKAYFKIKLEEQKADDKIFMDTLDVLYEVCNAGRICYFNNNFSHEREDSSVFERSIQALAILSDKIQKLSIANRKPYKYVIQKIDQANKGEECIHGIGFSLIRFFITSYSRLTKARYDSIKTGLSFKKAKGLGLGLGLGAPLVYFISTEHRFTLKPTVGVILQMQPLLNKLLNFGSFKTTPIKVLLEQKNTYFKSTCAYEPYLVTNNSVDNWEEVSDWRKVRFDNQCFDLFYLIKIITNDLNVAKNNNPFPKYPTNPFTQKVFTSSQLTHIKHLCNDNWIILNKPLHVLLNSPDLMVDNNQNVSSRWRTTFIDTLERKQLRYVRKNNIIDNALHCTGEWNSKDTIQTPVERLIIQYLNTADGNILAALIRRSNETTNENYFYTVGSIRSSNFMPV